MAPAITPTNRRAVLEMEFIDCDLGKQHGKPARVARRRLFTVRSDGWSLRAQRRTLSEGRATNGRETPAGLDMDQKQGREEDGSYDERQEFLCFPERKQAILTVISMRVMTVLAGERRRFIAKNG